MNNIIIQKLDSSPNNDADEPNSSLHPKMERLETVAEADEFRIWDRNRLKEPKVFLSPLKLDEKRNSMRKKNEISRKTE